MWTALYVVSDVLDNRYQYITVKTNQVK